MIPEGLDERKPSFRQLGVVSEIEVMYINL
jgi:hypothetical protein